MKSLTSRIAVATALSFALAAPALAGDAENAENAASEQASTQKSGDEGEHVHNRGDILVTAEGLDELDFIAGQDILELEKLQRNLAGQLGEVLVKVPGVSATSFAPGASRPILRGLDGERVRVLIDGLGTADTANTSADHATTIDPLTVTRVEVLRGPGALLFGSQAIGGVVNVIDRRIPIEVPDEPVHLDALFAADTVSNLRSGGASIDAALTENIVFHLDGSFRDTNDLEIPGFQLTEGLRNELLAEAAEEEAEGDLEKAEELREATDQRAFVPNSDLETWTVNGGIGFIFGESSFGASVGYFDTDYGVIKRPGTEHAHGEEGHDHDDHGDHDGHDDHDDHDHHDEEGHDHGDEDVRIGLEQLRVDFRGDIALGEGFFSRLKLRGGYSDYTHTEFEGMEVGTVFDTETIEARAELIQNGGGVIGAQFISRDFQAIGAEAFVQPNDTSQFALFTVQEVDLGGIQLEAAGRYEHVDVESEPLGVERNFDLFSGALSAVIQTEGGVRFGLTGSRSERAPAGEELFADGPHIATQAFEIGDVNLDVESAWGLETFLRGDLGDISFGASVYYQSFDDFIFLSPTGGEEDELPVFAYLQEDANFFGFEADLALPVVENEDFTVLTDLRASYVSADLQGDGNLPRIPPVSLLGALEAQFDRFDLRGEVQWFGAQDDVADFETETDDFAFVNLYLSMRPLEDNPNVVVQIAGENLFDVEGRRHSSFTKDFIPLPGRNLRMSVRLSF